MAYTLEQIEKDISNGCYEHRVSHIENDWDRIIEESINSLIYYYGFSAKLSTQIVYYAHDESEPKTKGNLDTYIKILKDYATILSYLIDDKLIVETEKCKESDMEEPIF